MKSIKCLLLSWLPFSQRIYHAERPPFFITLIVMTTRLRSAACHFISSKTEETIRLYFNSMSCSTLHSCSALSSFLSSCQLLFTSPSLGKTGGRGQTFKVGGDVRMGQRGIEGKTRNGITVIETNVHCHSTDKWDKSTHPLLTLDAYT